MQATLLLSLRQDISQSEQSEDQVTLQAEYVSLPHTSLTLKQLSPASRSALEQLLAEGATEEELSAQVLQNDGVPGLYKWNFYMRKLSEYSLLCYTLCADHEPLATVIPLAIYHKFDSKMVKPEKRYILSRFAHCRREQNDIILESPLGYAQVKLHNAQALAMVAELGQPRNCQELSASFDGCSEDVASGFLNLLLNAQAVSEVDEDGAVLEDTNPALAQWEFHDLLFHTRSRLGRHNNPFGKTYRFKGQIDPLPLVKPRMSDEIIPLHKPDLEQLKRTDPPFCQVLEGRRSIRHQGEQPITDQQLGEFLYRSARVKLTYHDELGGVTFRPYPGGGALHELEIYAVIDRCENIPSGLYHYDPLEHQLCKLSDRNWYVETLLEMAWHMISEESRPQVLFVITARFQRVQWKYDSIAYSVILKDLGGLYQTMYLVAEAMGLAPCALGGGHSDLFAQAAGLDYYAETSVGGFVLGSRHLSAEGQLDEQEWRSKPGW